jgi:cyclic pyranopterin phosphate synthase
MTADTQRLPQLRVAVNSRCGRRCVYCRPAGEAVPTAATARLDTPTVVRVARAFAAEGIDDVKLTGGDPALWPPLVECVGRLKAEGLRVQVISRHPKLAELAPALRDAGVDLFNVSLDTLDPALHREITGCDDLDLVVGALRACVRTGVPVKVNTVVMAGKNDGEVEALIDFCEREGAQTIKLLDVIRDLDQGSETYSRVLRKGGYTLADLYEPLDAVVARVRRRAAEVRTLTQGGLGHPMTSIRLPSGLEVLVKDHRRGAWYGPVCRGCPHYPCHDALMAVRLTADARLQFCLLREDAVIDLRPALARGDGALRDVVRGALGVYAAAAFVEGAVPRAGRTNRVELPMA